jgi:hypothetical protein
MAEGNTEVTALDSVEVQKPAGVSVIAVSEENLSMGDHVNAVAIEDEEEEEYVLDPEADVSIQFKSCYGLRNNLI